MRNTIWVVIAGIGLIAFSGSHASDENNGLGTVSDTQELCAESASHFADGQTERAIGALAPHWPQSQAELQDLVVQAESQYLESRTRLGESIDVKHVRSLEAGSSIVGHIFAIKYESQALRFTCRFYKPRDEWILRSFNWDEEEFLSI